MKKADKSSSAIAKAEGSTKDDGSRVCQPDAKPNVVRRFFDEMSKKHNVDIDSLNVHITGGAIYVSKYTPGYIEMFKLLEIIE
jgi:hypothetical protein